MRFAQRRDRRSPVLCTAIRGAVTIFVVGILAWVVVRCIDRIAGAYETVAHIAVGQTTHFDARVQLNSRDEVRLQIPIPGEASRPLQAP